MYNVYVFNISNTNDFLNGRNEGLSLLIYDPKTCLSPFLLLIIFFIRSIDEMIIAYYTGSLCTLLIDRALKGMGCIS